MLIAPNKPIVIGSCAISDIIEARPIPGIWVKRRLRPSCPIWPSNKILPLPLSDRPSIPLFPLQESPRYSVDEKREKTFRCPKSTGWALVRLLSPDNSRMSCSPPATRFDYETRREPCQVPALAIRNFG